MAPKLFGRLAKVQVARRDAFKAGFVGPLQQDLVTAVTVEGLRIQFRIEKNLAGQPNTADISVTNCSEATRRGMQATLVPITLWAGYEADAPNLPVLFTGDASTIDHIRRGPDWVTRIQCGDGQTAYRFARANKAWAPGATVKQVAKDLAGSLSELGIDVSAFVSGVATGAIAGLSPQFLNGFATQGSALSELAKLFPDHRLSIQNGELLALRPKQARDTRAPVLSAATGLIGSPEHGSPDKNGLPPVLKVKSLLLPRLLPGDLLQLSPADRRLAGNYKVQKVIHAGDTHGPDWTTDIECLPL